MSSRELVEENIEVVIIINSERVIERMLFREATRS